MMLKNQKNNYLMHYGVKGMKWGVRKDGKPKGYRYLESGGYINKGSNVLRITNDKDDKTYGNKKHVSITMDDHKKWQKYIGDAYKKQGVDSYNVVYQTTKDIKVASASEVGRVFSEKFLDDPKKSQTTIKDTKEVYSGMVSRGFKITEQYLTYPDLMATVNVAYQTKTGKQFLNTMKKKGYGAIADTHGMNTARDPLIIIDPDDNMKKIYYEKYK